MSLVERQMTLGQSLAGAPHGEISTFSVAGLTPRPLVRRRAGSSRPASARMSQALQSQPVSRALVRASTTWQLSHAAVSRRWIPSQADLEWLFRSGVRLQSRAMCGGISPRRSGTADPGALGSRCGEPGPCGCDWRALTQLGPECRFTWAINSPRDAQAEPGLARRRAGSARRLGGHSLTHDAPDAAS